MSVEQIFDEACNMIHKAYEMIITEIADENYDIKDLEFISADIAEVATDFRILDESIIEELSNEWIWKNELTGSEETME